MHSSSNDDNHNDSSNDFKYLMLTSAGVFEAFAHQFPDEKQKALQSLIADKTSIDQNKWLDLYKDEWLEDFVEKGWVEQLSRQMAAPNMPLDEFLPYVSASLSGRRRAAIGSNEGFCLARTGYTQEEADMLSVAAADFFDFLTRQQQRGWAVEGQAVSFFKHVDLLMPSTSFVFLWIDDSGYVLIIDGEPLTNNRALVELIWAIKISGLRFNNMPFNNSSSNSADG